MRFFALPLCCLLFSLASVLPLHAQDGGSAAKEAGALVTTGLDPAFARLANGSFKSAGFGREDVRTELIALEYMKSYWDQCQKHLTPDRVQMTVTKCTGGYEYPVNGYGVRTGTDRCKSYSEVPTGRWADHKLFAAYEDVRANAVAGLGMMVLGGNSGDTVAQAKRLRDQAPKLIAMNGCTSLGLKRFQENLTDFLTGSTPHAAPLHTVPEHAFASIDSQKLLGAAIEDVLTSDPKHHGIYLPDSTEHVTVTKTNPDGTPAEVSGDYDSWATEEDKAKNYIYKGSARLTFANGIPSCLYFFDWPGKCYPIGSDVLANWNSGMYGTKH